MGWYATEEVDKAVELYGRHAERNGLPSTSQTAATANSTARPSSFGQVAGSSPAIASEPGGQMRRMKARPRSKSEGNGA